MIRKKPKKKNSFVIKMSIKFSNVVEYLKSPHLVINVQKYFGVKYCNLEYNNFANNQHIQSEQSPSHTTKCSKGSSPSKRSPSKTKNQFRRHDNENGTKLTRSTDSEEPTSDSSQDPDHAKRKLIINNKFWYYLFVVGTALGDEIFYATFIPFWFWNVDTAVGRRVVFVWSSVMYVGQMFKDIIRWERPGPPVQRLQKKWALEYGMPSTHAMVAVSIPFSVLIYTYDR